MIEIYGTPWRTWWKGKKYFRFPDIRLRTAIRPWLFSYFWNWYDFIYVSDVNWKDKYHEPRHEDNPCIAFNFFNLFQIKLEFGRWIGKEDYSLQYWESLLNYVIYKRSLHESLKFSIWTHPDGSKTPITKVCLWQK